MARTARTESGWWVRHPYFLRTEPKDISEIVVKFRWDAFGDEEMDDVFSGEQEAMQAARESSREQRDQALKDLEFLSKPYTSPQGNAYSCSQETLEEWKVEARLRLRIAGKCLELCHS